MEAETKMIQKILLGVGHSTNKYPNCNAFKREIQYGHIFFSRSKSMSSLACIESLRSGGQVIFRLSFLSLNEVSSSFIYTCSVFKPII